MSIRHVQVGGTLVPGQSVYVPRPQDDIFRQTVVQGSGWINVWGCRTMGKSSLYAQNLQEFQSEKLDTVVIDVAADISRQPSAVAWVKQLLMCICDDLYIEYDFGQPPLTQEIVEETAAKFLKNGLGEAILPRISSRLILILDEYDFIQTLPYFNALLFALRSLQNPSTNLKRADFQKLTICFVGLNPLSSLGEPMAGNASPMGLSLELTDFLPGPETFAVLSDALPHASKEVIERLLDWSGGQPLITMDLVRRLQKSGQPADDLDGIARALVRPPHQFGGIDLFHVIDAAILKRGMGAYPMIRTYRSLLNGEPEAHSAPETKDLLVYGLIRADSKNQKVIKGEIFRSCFNETWADGMLSRLARMDSQNRGRNRRSYEHKRICVINAGGTLGMVERAGEVVAPEDAEEFKSYFQFLNSIAEDVDFVTLFDPRDSINIFPAEWVAIAEYIYKNRKAGIDGFVVAHGTDTMAYTASAVAFALGPHLSFPVVFTGAQTTPDVPFGDAHVNLYRACEVALHPIPEVVICFGNHVFRAVRAQKRDDRRFDGFESPTFPPLAEVTGEVSIRRELLRAVPTPSQDIVLRATYERRILTVPQFPGLEPYYYDRLLNEQSQLPNGIIIQTLGAGNVTNLLPYSFIPFVERAHTMGIPVVITSQYPPDPGSHTKYTPAQAPIRAGAIHAGNMTMAAAVTKFRWVLANTKNETDWAELSWEQKREQIARRMVEESVVGEF